MVVILVSPLDAWIVMSLTGGAADEVIAIRKYINTYMYTCAHTYIMYVCIYTYV